MCGASLQPLYRILGLSSGATQGEVRAAYRSSALRSHPDKGGTAAAFRLVVQAFEILGNPDKRSTYDSSIRVKASEAASPQTASRPRREPAPAAAAAKPPPAYAKYQPRASTDVPAATSSAPAGSVAAAAAAAGAAAADSATAPRMATVAGMSSRTRRVARLELESALELLRQVAIAMPPPQRVACLGSLGVEAKAALTAYMERLMAKGGADRNPVPTADDSDSEIGEAAESGYLSSDGEALLALENSAEVDEEEEEEEVEEEDDEEEPPRAATVDTGENVPPPKAFRSSKPRGRSGICGVFSYHDGYYAAGICLAGLRIETRRSRSLEVAIGYQALLVLVRQATTDAMRRGECFDDAVRTAVLHTFAEANTTLEAVGISFLSFLDVRKLIGVKIHGRRRTSLDESLASRARLNRARAGGWEAVRAEWITSMTTTCADQVKRRGALTPQQAEATADQAWERYSARRESIRPRQSRPADDAEREVRRAELARRRRGAEERRMARRERIFRRLAMVVSRSLARARGRASREFQKHQVEARRKAAGQRRQHVQERRARNVWHCRRDITMEEILGGYPGANASRSTI